MAPLPMAFGCLLGGILMEKYGRKKSFYILNVLFVIGWVMMSLSRNLFWLLLGRFITGLCTGLLGPPAPIYISETTAPKYRGFFLTTIGTAIALGLLITHVLGIYLSWQMVAVICGTIPFISYILVALVPESPSWLLKNDRLEEAALAFKWLRGHDEKDYKEFQSMVDGQMKLLAEADNEPFSMDTLIEIITLKAFYKPLLILLIYFATLQFSGPNAIAFYTVSILKDSLGDNINEYVATILVDLARLIASIIACICVRKFNRRSLTTFSGVTTAFSLLGLSLYLFMASSDVQLKNLSAIPLTLFAAYVLFITIGINPLPWTLTGELFPLRFRAIGSSIVTFFNFACFFSVVKTNPSLTAKYGGEGVYLLYGLLCLIGTIILTIYLPETKNKSLQEIEDSYIGKKKRTANEIQS